MNIAQLMRWHFAWYEWPLLLGLALGALLYGCGGPSSNVGHPCDPLAVTPPCGPGLTCSADCGPDLTCDVDGVCGIPCGNGNVVCSAQMVCMAAGNCIPPCIVNGAPDIIDVGNCEGQGLISLDDGRCVVPCWYFVCGVLGGHCPFPIPTAHR